MKKVLMGLIIFSSIIYFSLYFNMPGFIVKSKIQKYLDENYPSQFKINSIERDYCPDFLHQVWGYRIEIEDNSGIKVQNVFIQKKNGNWKLFKGSNIDSQYEKAKMNN